MDEISVDTPCEYPVQKPRLDAPRLAPRLIILLKVPPQFQIMPPPPIYEKGAIPVIRKVIPSGFWKNWWSPLK